MKARAGVTESRCAIRICFGFGVGESGVQGFRAV